MLLCSNGKYYISFVIKENITYTTFMYTRFCSIANSEQIVRLFICVGLGRMLYEHDRCIHYPQHPTGSGSS